MGADASCLPVQVMLDEVSFAYNELRANKAARLPLVRLQYPDFAVWQACRVESSSLQRQVSLQCLCSCPCLCLHIYCCMGALLISCMRQTHSPELHAPVQRMQAGSTCITSGILLCDVAWTCALYWLAPGSQEDSGQIFADTSRAWWLQIAFWKEQLAGVPELELPADFPRAGGHGCARGGWLDIDVPEEVVAGVEKFAANCGATVYMVLLSVLQLLLAAHAQQDDIVVSHSCLLQTCHNHFL